MRIDVHAHYWTDAYLDMLVELGRSDTATQRGIGALGGVDISDRCSTRSRAAADAYASSRHDVASVQCVASRLLYGVDDTSASMRVTDPQI